MEFEQLIKSVGFSTETQKNIIINNNFLFSGFEKLIFNFSFKSIQEDDLILYTKHNKKYSYFEALREIKNEILADKK